MKWFYYSPRRETGRDKHSFEYRKRNRLFADPEKRSRYKIEDFGNSLLSKGLADDCTDFEIVQGLGAKFQHGKQVHEE